jgi:hypothetical protein
MRKHPRVGRIAKTAGALAIALGASLGSANAASAAPTNPPCAGNATHTICFTITPAPNGYYDVHVGIDVFMPAQDAVNIISQDGQALTGYAMADDWPEASSVVAYIPETYEAAAPHGIAAEFDVRLHRSTLNTDAGQDEIFGRVKLYDARSGTFRTFNSHNVNYSF